MACTHPADKGDWQRGCVICLRAIAMGHLFQGGVMGSVPLAGEGLLAVISCLDATPAFDLIPSL